MRAIDPTLRGGLLDSPAPSAGRPNPLGGLLGDMNRLQKASLATTLLPVIPDVLGAAGDIQMYAQKPETRTPLNYGLSALGLLPFIGGATVFHGSPHLFDEFSNAKIGTGEGAQAYGHGLYFAENPEVAHTYRQAPGYNPTWQSYDIPEAAKKKLSELERAASADPDDFAGWGISELIAGDFSPQHIREKIIELAGDEGVDATQSLARFDNAVKELDNYQGYLYTVDLPDDTIDQMLDWDSPISKQSDEIKEAIEEILSEDDIVASKVRQKMTKDDWLGTGFDIEFDDELGGFAAIDADGEYVRDFGGDIITADTADELEEFLGVDLTQKYQYDINGEDILTAISEELGGPSEAAQWLNERGIPGVKYFDGSSRSAGSGSRNYVVFDDALPKIMKREQ